MAGQGRPKGGGLNRSQAIREFFEKNPTAKVKDCIEELKNGGVEVSQALVSGVLSRMQGKPGNKKRSRKGSEVTLREASLVRDFIMRSQLDVDVATKILNEFTTVVSECGGLDRFKIVLANYQQFLDEPEVAHAIPAMVSGDSEDSEESEDSDE